VYKRPYDPDKPMVCMDEATKQLTKEIRKPVAAETGSPARYDCEYERNGVCNLFMFYEPFGGKRYVSITDHRGKIDWALQVKDLLDNQYPNAKKVVLVMDNLNTHTGTSLYEAYFED
ncbi:MAG: transposase, partial [Thermodesulfobacteriota bacterium]|nr:transposase [Thermodesulfobacteriota bacterium]